MVEPERPLLPVGHARRQMHHLVDGRILLDQAPLGQRQVKCEQASDGQRRSEPSDEGNVIRGPPPAPPRPVLAGPVSLMRPWQPFPGLSSASNPIFWPSCGLLGTRCGRNSMGKPAVIILPGTRRGFTCSPQDPGPMSTARQAACRLAAMGIERLTTRSSQGGMIQATKKPLPKTLAR